MNRIKSSHRIKLFHNFHAGNESGFTITELMLVVVVLIGMTAIAVPSLRGMVDNFSGNRAVYEIISDLHVARSLAIRHRRNATVTFNDPENNQYTVSWNNPVTTKVVDLGAFRTGIQFENNPPGATTPPPVDTITFDPRGFGPLNSSNIYITDQNNSEVICIEVTFAGAISEMRYVQATGSWIYK